MITNLHKIQEILKQAKYTVHHHNANLAGKIFPNEENIVVEYETIDETIIPLVVTYLKHEKLNELIDTNDSANILRIEYVYPFKIHDKCINEVTHFLCDLNNGALFNGFCTSINKVVFKTNQFVPKSSVLSKDYLVGIIEMVGFFLHAADEPLHALASGEIVYAELFMEAVINRQLEEFTGSCLLLSMKQPEKQIPRIKTRVKSA